MTAPAGARRLAAIDVGTNSVKLLVADVGVPRDDPALGPVGDGNMHTVLRRVVTTRLGGGLGANGRLGAKAIAGTASAIDELAALARDSGAERIRVVGTAACRSATNVSELSSRVREGTGLDLEVLDPRREAHFGFVGAIGDTGVSAGSPLTAVLDIGGGSTEITLGRAEPETSISLPFGAVGATESVLRHDPPRPEELTNLIGAVQDELEEASRTVPALGDAVNVVGIAGTIVTIAAVELGLAGFDENLIDGMHLTRAAAEDVFRTLATESDADRRHNPGLPPERSDIIVAGCCILVAVMRRLHLEGITVSTRGLVHGVVADMARTVTG